MTVKQFTPLIIVLILIATSAIFLISRKQDSNPQEASENQNIVRQDTAQDTILLTIGNPDASATIVEYIDYKCPNCADFHFSVGKEISEKYIDTGIAKYEIRITPIIGPDSANAARGAYCAQDQGLFAEYHESVFGFMQDNYYSANNFAAELENILTTNKLVEILSTYDINEERFVSCVDSDTYNVYLDKNLLSAADDEIRGTPGFVVGEQSFVGSQPFSVFKTLLDIELR